MGKRSLLNIASSIGNTDTTNSKELRFDEEQLRQFETAKEIGVSNSMILQHPEWSATLMNFIVGREQSGSNLSVIEEVIRWLMANPTKGQKESGKLGDDLFIINYLFSILDLGAVPVNIGDIDDRYTEAKYKLLSQLLSLQGTKTLKSGRLSINYVGALDLDILMSEGDDDAYKYLQQLEVISANSRKNVGSATGDPMFYLSNRAWNMKAIVLELDDMNIRGKQINYAVDFAGGSINELVRILSQPMRSQELCDYINARTATDIKNGLTSSGFVAIQNGASFTDTSTSFALYSYLRDGDSLLMDSTNYKKYDKNVEAREVDWASKDVVSGVGTEEAIKICNARGFNVALRQPYDGTLSRLESVLLYNPKTGDMILASGAESNSFCYAGCSLYIYRRSRLGGMRGSSGWSDKALCFCHEFTYHDGLFSDYDSAKNTSAIDEGIDLCKIGFGISGLPVPTVFNHVVVNDYDIRERVKGRYAEWLCGLGLHNLSVLINNTLFLSLADKVGETVPIYKEYRNWFYDRSLEDSMIWSSWDVEGNLFLIRLAMDYCAMPEEIRRKMIDGLVNQLKLRDLEDKDKSVSWFNREQSLMSGYNKCKKLLTSAMDTKAILTSLRMPEISTLCVKPEWL